MGVCCTWVAAWEAGQLRRHKNQQPRLLPLGLCTPTHAPRKIKIHLSEQSPGTKLDAIGQNRRPQRPPMLPWTSSLCQCRQKISWGFTPNGIHAPAGASQCGCATPESFAWV